MSGIAGILRLDRRPVERETLIRMTDRLAHRGPDGVGHWVSGSVGLGCTLFWTTPEALGEKQPLNDESGQFTLVFDGRIDNRDKLQSTLRSRGARARLGSDAEIVLASYKLWEQDCAAHLLGDFAFAVWDDVKKRMYCARDHLGTKPFCYHLSEELFVFATEVKGVLAADGVPERIDEGRILDFLGRIVEGPDKTSTFFHDVKKLPPAHWMTVGGGLDKRDKKVETRRYWSLDPTRETRFATDTEYVEAFRDIFEEAVRCRLRGAQPVASMLSGGLDSSAIVGMARKLLESGSSPPAPPIRTFSAVSQDGTTCGETQGVRAMIAGGGIEPYTCTCDETHVYVSHFERIIRMTDNPFDDFILNVPMAMYALAAGQGVRVLLDGLDGDRVCSMGWEAVAFHFRSGHPIRFVQEARGLAGFFSSNSGSGSGGNSGSYSGGNSGSYSSGNSGRYSGRSFAGYTLSVARRTLSRKLPEGLRGSWGRATAERRAERRAARIAQEGLINPDFARRLGLAERLSAYGQMSCAGADDLAAMHVCSIEHPDLTVGLERYDRVAAAFSIEPRHPLLDRRLVEFCVWIPWDCKVSGGVTKRIFRESLEGLIPESVRWAGRRKHLGPDFSDALLQTRRDAFTRPISDQIEILPGCIDQAGYAKAVERYRADRNPADREAILAVAALSEWLRNHG